MSESTNISIRMDKELKEKADKLYSELGMNLSTAFNIFVRQSIRQGGIPFEVTTNVDPFYSEENQARLRKTIENYELGKSKPIIKTMAELEDMENE